MEKQSHFKKWNCQRWLVQSYIFGIVCCTNSIKEKRLQKLPRTSVKFMNENTISVRVVQQWFSTFRSENFELEDEFRGGRPKAMEADELEALLQQDPRQTTRELAENIIGRQQTSASEHLRLFDCEV